MSALAEHLAAHALDGITRRVSTVPYESETWQDACLCGWDGVEELAEHRARAAHAEHVATTWAETRTITVPEGLASLPVGTWLRDALGHHVEVEDPEWGPVDAELPALIVWQPEVDR